MHKGGYYTMDMIPLNEMYFGKPIQLTRIEDLFTEVKTKYSTVGNLNMSKYKQILRDPIFKKIAEQLTSLFGFKESILTISPELYINARTITHVIDDNGNMFPLEDKILRKEDMDSVVKVTNNGFRFITKKCPVVFTVVITYGCFAMPNISVQELVAVLLHEIGHQFFYVVTRSYDERANEKFADQLCSMYGYGTELATALTKMNMDRESSFDKKLKDIPILNFFYGLNQIRKNSGSDFVHPHLLSRINALIAQMEQDLKDTPMTPEAKADLEKQLANLKQHVKDSFDSKEGDNIGTRMFKAHLRNQPNEYWERKGNEEADKVSHPAKLNEKIKKYQHKKGWFL